MKKYVISGLVAAVIFTLVFIALDAIFRDLQSPAKYAVQAVVFGVLYALVTFLFDRRAARKKSEGKE